MWFLSILNRLCLSYHINKTSFRKESWAVELYWSSICPGRHTFSLLWNKRPRIPCCCYFRAEVSESPEVQTWTAAQTHASVHLSDTPWFICMILSASITTNCTSAHIESALSLICDNFLHDSASLFPLHSDQTPPIGYQQIYVLVGITEVHSAFPPEHLDTMELQLRVKLEWV